MPEVDGYSLIQKLRSLSASQGGKIPAIALTAYAGEATQQQVLTAGFQLYLAKPADPSKLVTAIAALVQKF